MKPYLNINLKNSVVWVVFTNNNEQYPFLIPFGLVENKEELECSFLVQILKVYLVFGSSLRFSIPL
jgi:hypothetical protein